MEDEFHCTFDDHSIIARHDEGPQLNHGLATHAHYHLRWEDQHGQPNTATLPSEIDITDAPEVPPQPVPAIPTPTHPRRLAIRHGCPDHRPGRR